MAAAARWLLAWSLLLAGVTAVAAGSLPSLWPDATSTFNKSRATSPRPFEIPSKFGLREVEIASRRANAPIIFAPWAAGLKSPYAAGSKSADFFCGATIITDRWALTAAFCVEDLRSRDVLLFYGSASTEQAKTAFIDEIIIHPDYRKDDLRNAIALIRVREPIILQRGFTEPYPGIPSGSRPPLHIENTKVFGWGSFSEAGTVSNNLLQLDVAILDQGLCNSPIAYAGKVSEDMFCARSMIPGTDVCQGFSGSGLISFSSLAPELLGLVSWGEGCGREHKPTVYVSVGHFRDWIMGHVIHAK